MGDYIVKTKFLPPGSSKKYWKKPELWKKYETISDYPLTVIKAGPGYGKSTTIAAFFKDTRNYFWYNVDELDADPAVFFLNVFYAFHWEKEEIVQAAIDVLTDKPDNQADFVRAINHFINSLTTNLEKDTYLIIDDFHLVADNGQIIELLGHFIKVMPPKLHLILSTREKLAFREWASWRLKRMVLVIDETDLMLNSKEIQEFFADQHEITISEDEAQQAAAESEGWIIALDLMGQGVTHGAHLDQVLNSETASLDLFFEYLAFEILENQTPKVREFLLKTAVLKNLRVDICNQLLEIDESQQILEVMIEKGFFVLSLAPDLFRYHHLVREFLLKVGQAEHDYKKLHNRAAEICLNLGEKGLAIFHRLAARDYDEAAKLIISSADEMLNLGRIDSLQAHLSELPEDIFDCYPQLYLYQGEVLRLKSMFNDALSVLQKARQIFLEQNDLLHLSHASQKIAMVYLDTVQPVQATDYLQEALRFRDKENLWEEASILKLMAENKANKGQLDQAMALQKKVQQIDNQEIQDSNIRARVLLRTGKLDEAIKLLEGKLAGEQKREMSPRSHRETVLILSLVHALKGEVQLAHDYASSGVKLGKQLDSPFIIAVAHMRLGHSLQLSLEKPKIEEARIAYKQSLKLVDELEIPRGRAEALLGLALLEAFYGDSNLGLKYGDEGLAILQQSGDQWLSGMLRVSIGMNHYFLGEFDKATLQFRTTLIDFADCKDSFCQLASKLWLALTYSKTKQKEKYGELLGQIFDPAGNKQDQILLSTPTLLGFRDKSMLVPLLLDAGRKLKDNKFLQGLLAEQGLVDLDYHPGYSLSINGFGNLRLWRGKEEIGSKEWQREKALELFLLLFINKGKYLPKETIYDALWPTDDVETAARNFKVSLNAVRKALEPDRRAQQTSYYILRNRSNYAFNEDSSYFFDVEEFERLIEMGTAETNEKTQMEYYKAATNLYQGDFLADLVYIDWLLDERERLRNLFLNTVDRLARYFYQISDNDEALKMTDLLLEHDPCWEPAYLLQMKVYERLKRPFIAIKVYQQCKAVLDRELNVTPMPDIEKFYMALASKM